MRLPRPAVDAASFLPSFSMVKWVIRYLFILVFSPPVVSVFEPAAADRLIVPTESPLVAPSEAGAGGCFAVVVLWLVGWHEENGSGSIA